MNQFPSVLNDQITQQGYNREDGARFMVSEPASGPHYAQLLTDDVPSRFKLQLILNGQHAALFRAWQRSNNYSVLHGEQFIINLRTEDGMLPQVACFLPNGIPQVEQISGDTFTYGMEVLVRRISEPSEGYEDLIVGIENLGGSPVIQRIVNEDLPEI